ncbi:hypothetical protein [Actinoplanes sp. NPDC026670]|uniref:hypothetical protein n=1 Tax=Actinoplanes sp. NPDC026670 TaxID=3154700 RepID=UPI00340EE947
MVEILIELVVWLAMLVFFGYCAWTERPSRHSTRPAAPQKAVDDRPRPRALL